MEGARPQQAVRDVEVPRLWSQAATAGVSPAQTEGGVEQQPLSLPPVPHKRDGVNYVQPHLSNTAPLHNSVLAELHTVIVTPDVILAAEGPCSVLPNDHPAVKK